MPAEATSSRRAEVPTERQLSRIRALSTAQQQALAQALAPRTGSRTTELVGYFASEGRVSVAELRRFLEERLPEYLVPAELTELPSLPKAVNGKIDRGALRALKGPEDEGRVEAKTPALSEREQRLAAIWSRVLQRPVVDAGADFFALGGHSLLATQVVMEVARQFGVEIPLAAILKHPTLGRLCRYIEGGSAPAVTRAPSAEPDGEPPLSPGQRRLWYASQLGDDGLAYKIVKVLDLRGRFRSPALSQAVGEIVRRHEALRTTFGYGGGRLVQRVQPPRPVAVEDIDLQGLAVEPAERAYRSLVEAIVRRAFDLETGPLLRVSLVRLASDHVRVLLDVHHIVVDGWSFGILVQELNSFFRAFAGGEPGRMPELDVQYRDVARAEERRLHPAELERQIAYWRERLAGAPAFHFRRTGTPEPAGPDGEIWFQIGSETSTRIARACAALQITPYVFLVAAYYVLLSAHGAERDVSIGTDVSNRDTADHARIIGFFANQVVLRLAPEPSGDFASLCRTVRDTVESAFENKAAPYDAVVRALGRDGSRLPPFRAMFSFHHRLPDLSLDGLRTCFLDARPPASKYELLVNVEEGPGGLQGSVEYSGAVLDREAAERIAREFVSVCETAARDVGVPVHALSREVFGQPATPSTDVDASRAARRSSLRRIIAETAGRSKESSEAR